MRLMQWVMAATFVCGLSVFTACSSDDDTAWLRESDMLIGFRLWTTS